MFQSGFFSRIFHFRRRRAAAKAGSVQNVARSSAPPSSYVARPIPFHPETTYAPPNTSTQRSQLPRTTFASSCPSTNPTVQVAQATLPFPDITSQAVTPPPIIVIGQEEEPQSPVSSAPAPASPDTLRSQNPVNPVSLLQSPPVPTTRRVSFQLPIKVPDHNPEDCPTTPLSTCSTLVSVSEVGPQAEEAEPESESVRTLLGERPPASVRSSRSVGDTPAPAYGGHELAAELSSVTRSEARAKHISFFNPQPVRLDVSRLSLPVQPTNRRNSRRESKRMPLAPPPTYSPNLTKKEKRTTRLSSELKKPETQEVLRVLSML